VIPLSFLRRLDSLKYTSVIALVAIGYLIVLVLAHFIKGDTLVDRGEVHYWTWQGPVQAFASFPVIVFAYTCHQNMFSILNEINKPTSFRTTAVVFASIGTACSIYILVAITGYLSYGDNIAGNIVAMYPANAASTIGRAAIVVLVMFSYPLQVHPCRASLDAVLKWRPGRARAQQERGPKKEEIEMSDARFAVLTTIIIILSYIVAMTVHSLEAVLAYVGSTGSTSISFILPGLFYYKISDPDSPHRQRLLKSDDETEYDSDEATESIRGSGRSLRSVGSSGSKKEWKDRLLRSAALALAIYGVIVMAVCLSMNIFFHTSH
jgi:amino acid permease